WENTGPRTHAPGRPTRTRTPDRGAGSSPSVAVQIQRGPEAGVREEVVVAAVRRDPRAGPRAAEVMDHERRRVERDEPQDVVIESHGVPQGEAHRDECDEGHRAARDAEDLPHRHRGLILWGDGEPPLAVDEVYEHRPDLVREHDRP